MPSEERTYLPRRLIAAAKPVVAVYPREVHTAGPGEAKRQGPKIPDRPAPDRAPS